MTAEIILVTTGLETGPDAAKAAAQYVARGLASVGARVREQICVCADQKQFQQAVAAALPRCNVLLVIGGLGAASGYLAKDVLCRGLRLPLVENPAAAAAVRDWLQKSGERALPGDAALSQLPKGCEVFPGQCGKIPGFALSSAKQHIIVLPETEREAALMFHKHVSPYLGGAADAAVVRTLRTYGVKEQDVREVLGEILRSENPAVTLIREQNEILVRVSAHAPSTMQAAGLCTPVLRSIVDRLGDAAYGLDVDSLQEAVVQKLEKKQIHIAIVEAGTDGILARVLAETEGGRERVLCALEADEIADKCDMLDLKPKLLKKRGNVSEYAAVACAAAVRARAGAHLGAAALTDGEEVFIAVCDDNYVVVKKLIVPPGDRDLALDAAYSRALNTIRLVADYLPEPYTGAIPLDEALGGRTVTDEDDGEDDSPRPGFFARLGSNFVIRKNDKWGVKLRKFIFILAVLVFLGSAGYVGAYVYGSYTAKQQALTLQEMFETGGGRAPADFPGDYIKNFAGLWAINKDVVAYISISDTQVKYPIVQGNDNDYYLRRDFYGNSNQHGIPFMDYRVDVRKPSDNMVVYGHNMKDGQIFGEIIPYKNLEYYQQHPVIDLTTLYEEGQYKIFSVFITNAYENQGPVFAYHDFIDAASQDDFTRFVDAVTRRSLINTTVGVEPGDELLTLSTCTYEFKDARLVVVARKVRPGEDASVDTSSAVTNPSPLMPDIWYATFGGSKPAGAETPAVNTASDGASPESASSSSSSRDSEAESLAREAEERAESRRVESEKAASEKAESDNAASDKAASEKAASDKAASEKEASEKAASEKEASEKAASEKAASEKEASEKAASEKAASEKEASEKEASEKAASEAEEAANASESVQAMSVSLGANSISVYAAGSYYRNADPSDIIPRLVQNEMGSTFNAEAIKAQAVAAYTYIAHANQSGEVPSVPLAAKADAKVKNAVAEVLGRAVYYKNSLAFTPYHATSAGQTTSSADVWGGSYPYLVSVDSSVDQKVSNYKTTVTMTSDKVAGLIESKLGISVDGDPADWFEIRSYAAGDYVGDVTVCGKTKSKSGSRITGRLLRESVLGLRSACFEIDYSRSGDRFTFTVYGYGHGVGLSQNGANAYAAKGWDYIEILEHYYPGTSVK